MWCEQRATQPNLHLLMGWDQAALSNWPSAETWTRRDVRWASRTKGRAQTCDGTVRETTGLWRISSYGQGAVRIGIGGLSLNYAQLSGGAPLPVQDRRSQMPGPYWLDIQTMNRGMPSAWRVNAGQVAYVYGDDVAVAWWAPPLAVDVGMGTGNLPVAGIGEQMVVETLCFVDIAEVDPDIDVDTGYLRLTETYFVDAAAAVDAVVPLGARTVQISTTVAVDTTAVLVSREFATAGVQFSIGAISITANQSIKTDIGGETHLRLPATGVDNIWTLDWGIQTG